MRRTRGLLAGTVTTLTTKHPPAVPLPDTQREELDRRLDDLEQDGPRGLSAEEVRLPFINPSVKV
jgi:putative addiction module component (TIGR02574 family)